MSLLPVLLDVNSWVPAQIGDTRTPYLLSDMEINILERDFSRCFEGENLSRPNSDGIVPYLMGDGWYNLSFPLGDVPSLAAQDTSDIFEFYFKAVRFSYGDQLDNTPGRFLGQNFSSDVGQMFSISPDEATSDLPAYCDRYVALTGRPVLPMEQKIAQDGNKLILGDLLITESSFDGGILVFTARIVVLKMDNPTSSSTTDSGSTLPSTTSISNYSDGINRSGVIAASVGGALAVLFSTIGVFLWMRRRRARRQATTTPIPPPIAPTSVRPSKIAMAYSILTSKSSLTQSSPPAAPILATNNTSLDEEERVLRELRGAMATSGFTVNSLFARLAGPSETSSSGASGQPPVPPAYDHRH